MQQFLEKLNQICPISTTTYYKNLTTKSRCQQFKNNVFASYPSSLENISTFENIIFNRLESSSTSGIVGMGFSIMQSFMDKVKVESLKGSGTKVYMSKILSKDA